MIHQQKRSNCCIYNIVDTVVDNDLLAALARVYLST